MTAKTWFQTTAIDYPNSRPHIGTAFEKLGADVQARYRRMEGYDVCFLMGNDENTVKVSKRAAELGQDPQAYCDDMARQFREVWDALDISYDAFIQTSQRAAQGSAAGSSSRRCTTTATSTRASYEGWYCEGCEEFKTDKQHEENDGLCPNHKTPLVAAQRAVLLLQAVGVPGPAAEALRGEPRLHPAGEPRATRSSASSRPRGCATSTSRGTARTWGIRVPFDPEFTIYVWFDALLTYITGIGYGDDEATFRKYWPATCTSSARTSRASTAPSGRRCCGPPGEEPPKKVFGHGFVYIKNEETGDGREDQQVARQRRRADGDHHEVQRRGVPLLLPARVPVPADGEFGWARFAEVYNSDLANNLGNLFSRDDHDPGKNYDGVLDGTAGQDAGAGRAGTGPRGVRRRRCAGTSKRAGTTRRCRRSCRTS